MSLENEQSAIVTDSAPSVSESGSSSAPSIRSEIEASRDKILGKDGGRADHAQHPDLEPTPAKEQPKANESAPAEKIGKPNVRNPRDVRSIGKLTATKHHLLAENAKLKQEIAALQKMQGEAPKVEDFKDERDFQTAQIQHNIEVNQAQKAVDAKAHELQQSEQKEWTDRCQTMTSDFGKFSEAYNKHHSWLVENQSEMMEFAQESTVGPIILENAFSKLFSDPVEYERWMSLTPAGRRHELVLAEHAITQAMNAQGKAKDAPAPAQAAPQNNAPAISKAPAPIKPEGGSGVSGSSGTSLRAQIEQSKRRQMA